MGKYNNYLKQCKILFVVYIVMLTWVILFKMAANIQELYSLMGIRNLNLIPFSEFARQNGGNNFSEIINNIIVFIPCGVYISILCKDLKFYKKILFVFMITVVFEIFQYVFAIGRSDITDIVENTLGGMAGIGILESLRRIFADEIKMRRIVMIVMTGITIAALGVMMVLVVINS